MGSWWDRGRRRKVEATITTALDPSKVLANASGVYVPVPDAALDDLTDEQRIEMDDLFARYREMDAR